MRIFLSAFEIRSASKYIENLQSWGNLKECDTFVLEYRTLKLITGFDTVANGSMYTVYVSYQIILFIFTAQLHTNVTQTAETHIHQL